MQLPGEVTQVSAEAGSALIKADPIWGSLVVLFMLTTAIAVWQWTSALKRQTDLQRETFEALSKRDEATTKVVNEAVRGYEDVSRGLDRVAGEISELQKGVASLDKQVTVALVEMNARK